MSLLSLASACVLLLACCQSLSAATVSADASVATHTLPKVSHDASLVIADCQRTIDLTTHIESVRELLTLANAGTKTVHSLLLPLPADRVAQHLSYLQGELVSQSTGKPVRAADAMHAKRVQLDDKSAKQTHLNTTQTLVYYSLTLPKSLAPGEQFKIAIISAYTHTLQALPAQILQDDPQLVMWNGSATLLSAQRVEHQTTRVLLQSNKIESYTKKGLPVARTTDGQAPATLTYGEFSPVEPLTTTPIKIHYQNNAPFATMTSMRKDIEISQWGNIAIEETYALRHSGAKLKGAFSRSTYQRQANFAPSAFRLLKGQIPLSASEVYCRDVIGNVSTSHVRRVPHTAQPHTVLEIEPRFPLFGGWTSDFYTGYNVPSKHYLSRVVGESARSVAAGSQRYVLDIEFGSMFATVDVDEAEVRVIMPEGAHSIEYKTPFDVDSVSLDSHKTHLDTTGRPMLVLRQKRQVQRHASQKFQVSYEFASISMLREPLLVASAFMLLFGIAMAYYRLDLSLESRSAVSSHKRKLQ